MAGLPGRELVMEDLKVCSALVSQSINHRNGATGGRKELRPRRGLLAQNPSLWGCLMSICRHLPLSSKESGTPFRYLQWPSLTVSTLLPPSFVDSTRETTVVCIGQNAAFQAASGFEHQFVCPRESGLGPTLEFAAAIQLQTHRTRHWAGIPALSV